MAAAAVQPPPSAANAFMLETLPDMTKNSETTTQPVTGNKEVAAMAAATQEAQAALARAEIRTGATEASLTTLAGSRPTWPFTA